MQFLSSAHCNRQPLVIHRAVVGSYCAKRDHSDFTFFVRQVSLIFRSSVTLRITLMSLLTKFGETEIWQRGMVSLGRLEVGGRECGIGTQNTPYNGRIFLLFQTSQAFQSELLLYSSGRSNA